ncbi:MAG: phasin family protein [bacterium]
MSDMLKRALLAGIGAVALTREKLESVVDELVKKGELASSEKPAFLNDLLQAVEKRQGEVQDIIQKEVKKILAALDLPTRAEIRDLKEEIEKLRAEMSTTKTAQ